MISRKFLSQTLLCTLMIVPFTAQNRAEAAHAKKTTFLEILDREPLTLLDLKIETLNKKMKKVTLENSIGWTYTPGSSDKETSSSEPNETSTENATSSSDFFPFKRSQIGFVFKSYTIEVDAHFSKDDRSRLICTAFIPESDWKNNPRENTRIAISHQIYNYYFKLAHKHFDQRLTHNQFVLVLKLDKNEGLENLDTEGGTDTEFPHSIVEPSYQDLVRWENKRPYYNCSFVE